MTSNWIEFLEKLEPDPADVRADLALLEYVGSNPRPEPQAILARSYFYTRRLDTYAWFRGIEPARGRSLMADHVSRLLGGDAGVSAQEIVVVTSWNDAIEEALKGYWWWLWRSGKEIRDEEKPVEGLEDPGLLARYRWICELTEEASGPVYDAVPWPGMFGGSAYGPWIDVEYNAGSVLAHKESEFRQEFDPKIERACSSGAASGLPDDWTAAELFWCLISSYAELAGPWFVVRPWLDAPDPFAPVEAIFAAGGVPIGPVGDRWVLFNPSFDT